MNTISDYKCALCTTQARFMCMECNPTRFYCGDHACHHLARHYPDKFGIEPPEKKETGYTALPWVLGIIAALIWIGNSDDPSDAGGRIGGSVAIFIVIVTVRAVMSSPSKKKQ
jgi:hypothetical protein